MVPLLTLSACTDDRSYRPKQWVKLKIPFTSSFYHSKVTGTAEGGRQTQQQ